MQDKVLLFCKNKKKSLPRGRAFPKQQIHYIIKKPACKEAFGKKMCKRHKFYQINKMFLSTFYKLPIAKPPLLCYTKGEPRKGR